MSLTIEQSSDLERLVVDLRTAEQRADAKLRAINIKGARALLKIARRVVHVRSGRLHDGLIVEGPFNVATGTLEARVSAPSVPYAIHEIERGGTHDFATRTIEEGADVIEQTMIDMEDALVKIIAGEA